LVVGREDLLTPVFIHEKMVTKIKNAQLIVVDGGHASVLERPNIMEKIFYLGYWKIIYEKFMD